MAVDVLATAPTTGALTISPEAKMVGGFLAAGTAVGLIAKVGLGLSGVASAATGVGAIVVLSWLAKENVKA